MGVNRIGRPVEFSQETADTICLALSEGDSLTKIAARNGMPAITTIFNWLERFPEFYKQYARARNFHYQRMGDEILDNADDARNDWAEDEDGNPIVNHENIQRSRLRVDTRKWLLSKMLPKLYGDKVSLEHSGPNGGPIHQNIFVGKEPLMKEGELEGLVGALERAPGLENKLNGNGVTNGNGTHNGNGQH